MALNRHSGLPQAADREVALRHGVSRTCYSYDGHAPMAAYLGREGYCLEFELRVSVTTHMEPIDVRRNGAGKRVAVFEVQETRHRQGYAYKVRRVMRITGWEDAR